MKKGIHLQTFARICEGTCYFASSVAEHAILYVQIDRFGVHKDYYCDKMLKNSDTKEPIERLAYVVHKFLTPYGRCVGSNFTEYVRLMKKNDMIISTETDRVWKYQECTQFGWFKPLDTKWNSTLFSKHINFDFYLNTCKKAFKPTLNKKFITRAVTVTNELFRGLKIDVPRLIFVYGTNDPFKSLGITSTKNKKHINVVAVKGGSRSSELGGQRGPPPQPKKDAQKKITDIIDSWL